MSDTEQRTINPWTIWVPIIIMVGGLMVFYNWATATMLQKQKDRPPYSAKLERDLDLLERGRPVKLSQLKGKAFLAAHFYTVCPMGCTVLADKMKQIREEVAPGSNKLRLVSFAIDESDDAKRLTEVAKESYNVKPEDDSWWFVNGDQKTIRNYLTLQFKFYTLKEKPPETRTSPVDKYEHDMRIALVDHQANLRGLYDIMSPDPQIAAHNLAKLKKDLAFVVSEVP